MSNDNYYIIIDCSYGIKRPDTIFNDILLKTNLTINDFENTSRLFGEWRFQLKNKDKINDYIINIPIFKNELTNYYSNGIIRYAEWYPNC